MGNSTTTEIISLAASIVVLAGVTVAIVNGKQTAAVVGSFGSAFYKSIAVATRQKVPS